MAAAIRRLRSVLLGDELPLLRLVAGIASNEWLGDVHRVRQNER